MTAASSCTHAWEGEVILVEEIRGVENTVYEYSHGLEYQTNDIVHSYCKGRQDTCRIGEAKKPGPTICSVNPGGWSRVDGTLHLKHDIVAVQETFLLRDSIS
eukprot:129143-Amphidinium_carterae.1